MRKMVTLLIVAVVCSSLQPAFGMGKAAKKEKWQEIFDGKTLKGWEQKGGEAKYEVKDGAVVGTTVPNTSNSFLCTKKRYADFILELEFKVDPGMNSGIQIRSNSFKDYRDYRVHGYQVEIDPLPSKNGSMNFTADGKPVPEGTPRSWSGGIYDEARRGWLNDLSRNEPARNAFKDRQWNHYRIEAIGDSIKTWVNGVPAADLKDDMTASGFIALQVHGLKGTEMHQIRWRNIKIQDLGGDTTPVMQSDPAEEKSSKKKVTTDTMGAKPPKDAIVLLDKSGDLSNFVNDVTGKKIGWKFSNGELQIPKEKGNLLTKKKVQDFILHLEFNVNEVPGEEGTQHNGNSGVYIQKRYELQILNSHGREPEINGCGAIYKFKAPDKNVSRPAGQWQSYDITFIAPRWTKSGKKIADARITVIHNGETIHNDVEIPNKTGNGDAEGPKPGPIKLQNHGNPVKFRNIWMVDLSQ
jgi:hypothetical protein